MIGNPTKRGRRPIGHRPFSMRSTISVSGGLHLGLGAIPGAERGDDKGVARVFDRAQAVRGRVDPGQGRVAGDVGNRPTAAARKLSGMLRCGPPKRSLELVNELRIIPTNNTFHKS